MRDEPNGYCFFNNAAIAAKFAVETLGLERVLLLDWDLHHGQGSQYMFYEDPRCEELMGFISDYFSIYRSLPEYASIDRSLNTLLFTDQ